MRTEKEKPTDTVREKKSGSLPLPTQSSSFDLLITHTLTCLFLPTLQEVGFPYESKHTHLDPVIGPVCCHPRTELCSAMREQRLPVEPLGGQQKPRKANGKHSCREIFLLAVAFLENHSYKD